MSATATMKSIFHNASLYGVLDMAGNAEEWVADWYAANYYGISPAKNPQGPSMGRHRALRNGSWYSSENHVRSASRGWRVPDIGTDDLGFRCARSQ